MQKAQKKKSKIVFFVSALLIIMFILFYNLKNKQKLVQGKQTKSEQKISISKINSRPKPKEEFSEYADLKLQNRKTIVIEDPRSKVFKYSKRFLQIDQDLSKYTVLKDKYYLINNPSNRSRYPAGIIQKSHILVKSKKKRIGDSVFLNKDTGNYSLFNRVDKFIVRDVQGDQLLTDLKPYKFKWANYKYELKFDRTDDAVNA